jgi:hypothetical protein
MSNGTFQQGTWNALPTNCTTGFWLTYIRCAEYGVVAISKCQQWATGCIEWAWQTTKHCSWWSWLFCAAWALLVTLVCLAFGLVCAVVVVVEYVGCLLWTTITFWFCVSTANGGTAFLLTDGTVMMQECASLSLGSLAQPTWPTVRWWKLTPDQSGSYRNGSWSRLADSHIARKYFASGVLADGRVVICGGEYSNASGTINEDETNSCEIYDPVADTWTTFDPPKLLNSPDKPWTQIGDAPCAVLPDGTFLLGSIEGTDVAKLDPATLTWTSMSSRPDGVPSGEESWVLMPDNTIATPSCQNAPNTWVYSILNDKWNPGNQLNESVVSPDDSEIGPGLLRYDGTAFFLGANEKDQYHGNTAIYSATATPKWMNGPVLPSVDVEGRFALTGAHDAPAALLVNGNILVGVGEKVHVFLEGHDWSQPSWFFECDGTTFFRTNDPPNNDVFTYMTRLLLLPDGDVLFCTENDSSFYAYHSDAAVPQDSFRPVIQTCPATFAPGTDIQVSGLQFNGLSQAVGYGDDSQTATNYPLVRIVNKQTNRVRYCRTFNHTTVDSNGNTIPSMGVGTGAAVITTNVSIPWDIDNGDSWLYVVANGIPSEPFDVGIWPILV